MEESTPSCQPCLLALPGWVRSSRLASNGFPLFQACYIPVPYTTRSQNTCVSHVNRSYMTGNIKDGDSYLFLIRDSECSIHREGDKTTAHLSEFCGLVPTFQEIISWLMVQRRRACEREINFRIPVLCSHPETLTVHSLAFSSATCTSKHPYTALQVSLGGHWGLATTGNLFWGGPGFPTGPGYPDRALRSWRSI